MNNLDLTYWIAEEIMPAHLYFYSPFPHASLEDE